MAQSNHERVGKALELLNKELKPFIEREMMAVYGACWLQEAAAESGELLDKQNTKMTRLVGV